MLKRGFKLSNQLINKSTSRLATVSSSTSFTYNNNNNNNNDLTSTSSSSAFGKRSFFTVINQYENGVTFTLGRLTSVKGPGIRILIPMLQTMEIVDLRTTSIGLDRQEIITRDNISLVVDAVVYYKVIDPEKAVIKVVNHDKVISELAQVKIREILSQNTLDDVLHNREKFGSEIIERVRDISEEWGVVVERINLKDIKFEEGMVRAMAKKAEAERLREAKIISAESEVQTSQQILEAARMLECSPLAMRLRELDSLQQIAKESSNKIIFVPTSLFGSLHAAGELVKEIAKDKK
ncbi:Erythrocyte band 7 membrane like protein [Cavenderia fasciculata]|uniref:Erythrocyte band 7 membrane like protein n=1 Tax=Cavenderia fasciculata TaxID=261658 RepID=F4QFL3_CACFS|nr:Erythrocyte band 7 membrane like protein [Cavenderia fasciculata]EGG13466.1 Erythrocyte band 7 membrane like protein [Cavenderia fasciculata]|eukprot:XP_004350170.1 Erythrocyte band 7 membrane like protein [Cavenderia fasciculata]